MVVKHSLWEEVWAKVWPIGKNNKQDVAKTLDSVEVVCLCEKARSEVISSYNYTNSSEWGLLETQNLLNMPYSVESTYAVCFIHE